MPKCVRLEPNGKFLAQVCVGGKRKCGTTRDTLAEAEADAAQLFAEQKAAKAKKQADNDTARANKHAEHVDELEANDAAHGGDCELDGLSRDILKLALADSHLGAADNVEYGLVDSSVYARANDMGFNSNVDYELDEGVPTFAIQLKAARSSQPCNDKMDKPQVVFGNVNHYNHPGLLVLMLYIPPGVEAPVTRDDLKKIKFWYDYGAKLTGLKNGSKVHMLKGGRTADSVPKSGLQLRDTIEREFRNQEKHNGLVPYGVRARLFENPDGTHAKGQAAADALRRQVLNPLGALLLPPADGREGGASDVRIHIPGGEPKTAQFKHVHLRAAQAGFSTDLSRHAGSYSDAEGEKKSIHKPYTVGENDLYVFVFLDERKDLAEYWCATETDMVGDPDDITQRLISDANGKGGVMGTYVHPLPEDKERLGDTVPNKLNDDDTAARTRKWVQSIGRIAPPGEANALADRLLADKRALHAEKRMAALEARVEGVATEAGPSSVTNNITINNNINLNVSGNAAGKRALGSLDGWVKRLRE